MRQTISVEALIKYLKEWCVKPEAADGEQRPPGDESEGAEFTSTVQHIHNIYSYLRNSCSQTSLKELFQHSPAVFVQSDRYVRASAVPACSLRPTQPTCNASLPQAKRLVLRTLPPHEGGVLE